MGKFSRLGNDLYSGRRSIDFVGRRWIWYSASAVIVLLAVAGLSFKGLNFGIEFTGGAQYSVATTATQDKADALRSAVSDTGVPNASSPIVTTSGSRAILVQTEPLTEAESAEVVDAIVAVTGVNASQAISQTEIGASWGKQVAERSAIGLIVFLVLVVLFIWAYFREWKMSAAALVALAHDVVITVGIYALSGFEVSPATVTGVLTILGFSLYDTVVVFDKVRENTGTLRDRHTTYAEQANLAVNQTVMRSLNTSLVALLPVGALLYAGAVQLGSGALKDLALALFIGMAAGAYSSIFIATPLLVQLKSTEDDVKLAEKRAAARRREVDPYASVPTFSEDMPIQAEPTGEPSPERPQAEEPVVAAPRRTPEAMGRGRTVPQARGPVGPSGAAGRQQPSRRTRSKRGKK